MNDFEVGALKRDETGKGAMRRLRTTGRVPGVIYGTGGDPQNISLKANELRKHLEHEAFFSHILTVSIGGEKVQAVLKDLQRHPASYEVTHVDFLRVSATEALTMRVPLHFVNAERAPAHKAGGVFSHMLNDVEVSCLPGNLPEFIEVDLGGLEMGESVHLSGLAMPAGVSLAVDVSDAAHDHTVATVHMPHALDSGEEGEDEQISAEVPVVSDKDDDED